MLDLHLTLVVISLAHGLACYAIALAIILAWRSDSQLPFTRALPFLAAFGFLRGTVESVEVITLLYVDAGAFPSIWWLDGIRVVLLAASYFFLLWFGSTLVSQSIPNARWVWYLAPALIVFWGGSYMAVAWIDRLPNTIWPSLADGLARSLLALPGGLLAVWGLHGHKKTFDEMKMSRAGSDCIWAGILFMVYSVIIGMTALVSLPLRVYLPSHDLLMLPTEQITEATQAVLAVGIAFFILRVMRVYQEELRLQVEDAERDRLLAQQDALETQQKAAEQLRQWNETLEQKIVSRTHDLVRQQREAEALYRIGAEISAVLDLDTILSSVAEKTRYLLGADLATVTLVEHGRTDAAVRTSTGARTNHLSHMPIEPGIGLVGKVLSTGDPIRVDDYLTDQSFEHSVEMDAMAVAEDIHAHLAVPVRVGNQVRAVLLVASRGDRLFNSDDEWLLTRLAVMTGIAIQNSRLHGQAQQIAILEERERLAREIHDGLAQTLGCIGMMCGAVQQRMERGQSARLQSDLAEIEQLARAAYSDAREAILGLRVSVYGGRRLVESLREYVSRFREQSKLETRLKIEPGWSDELDEACEVQVMRIIQEALSNVRKHASASTVAVELSGDDTCAKILVRDDGIGFKVEARPEQRGSHFGMSTMKERARSIGAEVIVRSAPGLGTSVLIRLPKGHASLDGSTRLWTVA